MDYKALNDSIVSLLQIGFCAELSPEQIDKITSIWDYESELKGIRNNYTVRNHAGKSYLSTKV